MRPEPPTELNALTRAIIGGAFAVSNALGHGFLETVYKNALLEEMVSLGLTAETEKRFSIYYREKQVGCYIADIVVENKVIVELKAVDTLLRAHGAQLLNYLRASGLPVGLLMNFGQPKLEFKRILL